MCSSIWLKDSRGWVLGVNYDFYFDDGLLVVNRRGASKFALSESKDRLTWRSQFGSVTLNQFGCELPTAGMNEQGLCIHLLQSDGDPYPANDQGRPELVELQWMQYVLDTAPDVETAIQSLEYVSLQQGFIRLQFAVVDANAAALIAPVDGRFMVSHFSGSTAVTNTPFERALDFYEGRGARGRADSLSRFRKLYPYAQRFREEAEVLRYAFDGLDRVRVDAGRWSRLLLALLGRPQGITAWQTVFLPEARQIHLKTMRDARLKSLCLGDLRFDAEATNCIWDLRAAAAGDLNPRLVPYRRELNRDLIEKVYGYVNRGFSREERQQLAEYPELFTYEDGLAERT